MSRGLWLAGGSLVLTIIVGLCISLVAPRGATTENNNSPQPEVVQAAAQPTAGPSTLQNVSVSSKPAAEEDFNPFTSATSPAPRLHRPIRKLSAPTSTSTPEPAPPINDTATAPATAPVPMILADLIEKVERSVVRIKVYTNEGGGIGSGFVASPDGILIVTNFHVIEGCMRAEVGFRDNVQVKVAGVRAYDPQRDLAVIQIAAQAPQRPALAISPSIPRKGETVVALGSPRGFSFTASDGIVSGIRDGNEIREIIGPSYTNDLQMKYIQTTTPISPGNSGGPLVNNLGEVVGINTFCRTDSQNLNFAVASEHVQQILTRAESSPLIPLTSLPRSQPEALAGAGRPGAVGRLPGWEIKLPDGKIFSSAMCEIDLSQLKSLRNVTAPPALVEYSSGKPRAIAWHTNGTLDGTAIVVTESGRPTLVAGYDDGKFDGNVMVISDSGWPQMFVQYAKGRLEGFRCQFQQGMPLFISQYSKDKLVAMHYVSNLKIAKSFKTADDLGAGDLEAGGALRVLNKSVEDLAETDRGLRKAVREIDQDERQARASALSVEKRARERARGEARAAASQSIMNSLRRGSGF